MYADLRRKICACETCKKCKRAAYRKANREEMKLKDFIQDLKKNYGMSYNDYQTLHKAQDGRCACCNRPETDFKRRLHVDHNHVTGQIRGLLCTKCNPGIGYFDDDVDKLKMAVEYLNKFKKVG